MTTAQTRAIRKVAEADFPTEYGQFRIFGFELRESARAEEAVVLVMGNVLEGRPPLVRIHSQCLTGDVFHSLRCDCRAQLEIALRQVGHERRGIIIYEHQEGRGIGLMNKLRAYELQDRGADTVEANHQLGFPADAREYGLAIELLKCLDLCHIKLMTNNPRKFDALKAAGIEVVERVAIESGRNPHNAKYLDAKRAKLGHWLTLP